VFFLVIFSVAILVSIAGIAWQIAMMYYAWKIARKLSK